MTSKIHKSPGARLTNLFLVGAAKASTTSAYSALGRLAEVFAPELKEPNHFCTDLYRHPHFPMTKTLHAFANLSWVRNPRDYSALYGSAATQRYLLDGSTTYLYSREAARNIFSYNPEARVVVLLRDPVRRAWSEYQMNVSIGLEFRPFVDAVKRELSELQAGRTFLFSRYVWAGLYAEQVGAYLDIFPRQNVFVDVVDRPGESLADVVGRLVRFLQLEAPVPLGGARENAAKRPASKTLNSLLYYSGLKAAISRLSPAELKASIKANYYAASDDHASPADAAHVASLFSRDVRALGELAGLDLRHWLPAQV